MTKVEFIQELTVNANLRLMVMPSRSSQMRVMNVFYFLLLAANKRYGSIYLLLVIFFYEQLYSKHILIPDLFNGTFFTFHPGGVEVGNYGGGHNGDAFIFQV